ncbi:MAG TPA: MmcQ/YjbR family DNA-binding protein [Acidobacteriaceae bacterium]
MATAADLRRIALSLEGVVESSHMGAADFRVGGHIFATLASIAQGYGNLMLTPELQQQFVTEAPRLFLPIAGGWGRMGSTHIRLVEASQDELRGALIAAYKVRLAKNSATKKHVKKKTR